jgi:hypothetical protein
MITGPPPKFHGTRDILGFKHAACGDATVGPSDASPSPARRSDSACRARPDGRVRAGRTCGVAAVDPRQSSAAYGALLRSVPKQGPLNDAKLARAGSTSIVADNLATR